MNKELIKMYFEEFEHWINGGKLHAKFVNDPWEEAPEDIFSYSTINFILAIDDEYAEFRRALAEGKIVEYLDFRKEWRNLKENCRRLEGVRLQELRIKPEPKFKVGNWVIHNGVVKRVTKAIDGYIDSLDNEVAVIMKEESLELWEPKEGEWCWVFNKLREIPVLRRIISIGDNFKNRFDNEKFTKAVRVGRADSLDEEVGYRFCEPFIGQLPTSIKNTRKGREGI